MKKFGVALAVLPLAAFAALRVVDDQSANTVLNTVALSSASAADGGFKIGASAAQIQVPAPKEVWTVPAGPRLSDAIEAWTKKKPGWKLKWDTKTDYVIEAPLRFEGTIDEAAAQFIRLYEKAEKPLIVKISLQQQLIYVTNRNQ